MQITGITSKCTVKLLSACCLLWPNKHRFPSSRFVTCTKCLNPLMRKSTPLTYHLRTYFSNYLLSFCIWEILPKMGNTHLRLVSKVQSSCKNPNISSFFQLFINVVLSVSICPYDVCFFVFNMRFYSTCSFLNAINIFHINACENI